MIEKLLLHYNLVEIIKGYYPGKDKRFLASQAEELLALKTLGNSGGTNEEISKIVASRGVLPLVLKAQRQQPS